MKNVLLFFAAGALLLTGCIKNETTLVDTPSDQKIVFEAPVVSVATRGSADAAQVGTQADPYSKDEWFTVHAIKHNAPYATGTFDAAIETSNTTASVFMNHVDVKYDESTPGVNGWVAVTGTYVWPKIDYLTFMAYSPAAADKDGTFTYSKNGLAITDYTVKDVGSQYDLMFTDFAKDKKSDAITTGTNYSGVQLTFKHALSSVLFSVGLAQDYSDLTITINSITLNSFKKKGDFAQNLADGDVTSTTSAWTVEDTPTASYTVNTKGVALTYNSGDTTPLDLSGANQNGNYIILMPQDLSDSHTMSVEYTVTPINGTAITETVTIELNDYYYKLGGTGNDIALTKFEMGYQYTFNIKVGVDRIYFAPNVTEWTDAVIDVTID